MLFLSADRNRSFPFVYPADAYNCINSIYIATVSVHVLKIVTLSSHVHFLDSQNRVRFVAGMQIPATNIILNLDFNIELIKR